jgi:hypothetical protein
LSARQNFGGRASKWGSVYSACYSASYKPSSDTAATTNLLRLKHLAVWLTVLSRSVCANSPLSLRLRNQVHDGRRLRPGRALPGLVKENSWHSQWCLDRDRNTQLRGQDHDHRFTRRPSCPVGELQIEGRGFLQSAANYPERSKYHSLRPHQPQWTWPYRGPV